ncbi:hypothetical protein BJV77DRAFT_1045872, partial [Russula vinacea]
LLDYGLDINVKDDYGLTPLSRASEEHNNAGLWEVEIARLLLECGANVEAHDEQGRTPQRDQLITLLLEHRAK